MVRPHQDGRQVGSVLPADADPAGEQPAGGAPPSLALPEATADLAALDVLRPRLHRLRQIGEHAEDTELALGRREALSLARRAFCFRGGAIFLGDEALSFVVEAFCLAREA